MIDNAAVVMAQGVVIAAERKEGQDDNMTSSHFHGFFELYYLEACSRQYVVDDRLYAIKPHTLVVLPPRLMHHSYGLKGAPFRRVVVCFTPEGTAPGLYERLKELQGVHELTDAADIRYVEEMLQELLSEEDSGCDELSLAVKESLLNLLIVRILRLKSRRLDPLNVGKIRKEVAYISEHYAQDLSLDDLSARFYISKFHLCHEFKKYTGNTVIEYRNFLRILHAQRLFMESDLNLTAVSEAVSFSSLTHFERVLMKTAGIRPHESRRQIMESKKSGQTVNSSLPLPKPAQEGGSDPSIVLQSCQVKRPGRQS